MHHLSRWAATFHFRLSWFNILISPVWCHQADTCVHVCDWVCLLQTVMEDEKLRSWRWSKNRTSGKQSGCGAWWMPQAFFSLSAFFFSLLISLPTEPPSISPNSLTASISEGVFACAHVLEMCSNVYSFRSSACCNVRRAADDWLSPDTLMLMTAALLFPLTTQSKEKSQKHTYIMDCISGKSWRVKILPLGLH